MSLLRSLPATGCKNSLDGPVRCALGFSHFHRGPMEFNHPNVRSAKDVRMRCYNRLHTSRFPGSSMVEHSAVNRRVASSNLARGANLFS